jgi:hypothetical protein
MGNDVLKFTGRFKMKLKLLILLASGAFASIICCCKEVKPSCENETLPPTIVIHHFPTFEYDSLTISQFFRSLTTNHVHSFYFIDSTSYNQLCQENGLVIADSLNKETYFSLLILHELFTCQSASNCSKGEILNIPYFWHWINPNPRHHIYLTATNDLLKNTPPSPEFQRFQTFADIDRTPYLFLSELLLAQPKYHSADCDTFSTFGWCSEREMAFVALTNLFNHRGKVVVAGNHSWSELHVQMRKDTEVQNFIVRIDNTFDSFYWRAVNQEELNDWEKTTPNNWYNRKANSLGEIRRIDNHPASTEAMARIERKILEYLKRKINS